MPWDGGWTRDAHTHTHTHTHTHMHTHTHTHMHTHTDTHLSHMFPPSLGCAFVTFVSKESAEQAQAKLHDSSKSKEILNSRNTK